MEFRKMLMITLYAEQIKRHRFIEQSFRLCGRRRGRDVSRKQHRNMYTIKGETDHRPRLDAWDKRSDLVLWEDLEGAGGEIGMGKTCEPKAFSFQCMTKFTKKKKKRITTNILQKYWEKHWRWNNLQKKKRRKIITNII